MDCSNIIFVGGIHGVGKSTICRRICAELNIEYLSASKLIKWSELNEDTNNKKVEDLSLTQDRLIVGLRNVVQENKTYVLDGHFCLLNKENEVIKIPFETFEKIKPIAFIIILAEIEKVKNRLEIRDNKLYDFDLLQELQDKEIAYVEYLADNLNVPLYIYSNTEYFSLIKQVETILKIGK
ncbi:MULTISPECIES: ATP-binding protein [Capnocytophaga]|uniref:ATP-binding protein n=1 Tax=Capnocytophaga TaxID=1016 RepID=UPI0015620849|nr:ATP-binding protein [Capnocytophaga canis]